MIADGLRSFVEVGRALSTIRDGGLYREQGFRSFEVYCAARWSFTKGRASQLITGASVVYNCKQAALEAPNTESVARQLARLKDAEEQAAAWAEAVETAPPSGFPPLVASTSVRGSILQSVVRCERTRLTCD